MAKRIEVIFKLPKHIEQGLNSGRYVRKGGVIVNAGDKKVVMWLKEGNVVLDGNVLGKVGQIANIAECGINIITAIALNEKLNAIQDELREINSKIEFGFKAEIMAANQLLNSAELINLKKLRYMQLSQAREKFYQGISIYSQYMTKHCDLAAQAQKKFFSKWDMYPALGLGWFNVPVVAIAGYGKSRLDEKCIREIFRNIIEAIEYLKIIELCYISVAKTYYLQGELIAAKDSIEAISMLIADTLGRWEQTIDDKGIEDIKRKFLLISIDPIPLIKALSKNSFHPTKEISNGLSELVSEVQRQSLAIYADRAQLENYKVELLAIPYQTQIDV